jgi:hypothetical protein
MGDVVEPHREFIEYDLFAMALPGLRPLLYVDRRGYGIGRNRNRDLLGPTLVLLGKRLKPIRNLFVSHV